MMLAVCFDLLLFLRIKLIFIQVLRFHSLASVYLLSERHEEFGQATGGDIRGAPARHQITNRTIRREMKILPEQLSHQHVQNQALSVSKRKIRPFQLLSNLTLSQLG